MTNFRFKSSDLETFADASHDRNPLHMSRAYAKKTACGEPVVFGVLASLAALGSTDRPEGCVVVELVLTFRNPLFCDVNYFVEVKRTKALQVNISVMDAGRVMMTCVVKYREGIQPANTPHWSAEKLPESADHRSLSELQAGVTVTGRYSPSENPFIQCIEKWQLSNKGLTQQQIASLMFCSYLIGMRLPGETALFSRLAIQFPNDTPFDDSDFRYTAGIESYDERFGLLQIRGELQAGGVPFAPLQLSAFNRQVLPGLSIDLISATLPRSNTLKGKTALVTGGSRGLGAALVASLVTQGCDVFLNYFSSAADAAALRDRLSDEDGQISLVPGNAGDAGWCGSFRDQLQQEGRRLDILVCNASPVIRNLGLSLDSVDRIQRFLGESMALASVPITGFRELLMSAGGHLVYISSAFANEKAEYPPDFAHYVSAKSAAEGFVRAVAAQSPNLHCMIVRPPRLLTDQTNTPTGRDGASQVEPVAASIVKRLCSNSSDVVDCMEFDGAN